MSLRLIIGRAGSGKTTRCLSEIVESIDSGAKKPLILLVPNQFSLEMEKKLVQRTSGRGMDLAQVLSFERLSYRVFAMYGKPAGKTLDETAKRALLRKILYSCREELKYYGGAYAKDGFIEQISGLISELCKYGVDHNKLAEIASSEELQNTVFTSKMNDLSFVLRKFSEFIEGEYITLEQNLDLLAEALPDATYFYGAKVWIDGFFRFTEQDLSVIKGLLDICESVTVSLTMPETTVFDGGKPPDEYDPFFENRYAALKIIQIAGNPGTVQVERLLRKKEYGYADVLSHLEKNYFYYSPNKREDDFGHVAITRADSIYDEANKAAAEITRLVRENGMRYRDVAVCACDLEAYENVLTEAFKRYEIPYFIDMNKPIFGKKIVEMIRALLEVCVTNRSADSVIRLLRTGLFDFSEREVDVLENYALEYGIKGWRWDKPCEISEKSGYSSEEINGLKLKVCEIVNVFLNSVKKNKYIQIRQMATEIYLFIERGGVKKRLLEIEENQKDTVQVWNIVSSIFDKLVEILGDEEVDVKTFAQVLEGALGGAVEGFIPQTCDAVILGDIRRTRLPEVKALLVLGLNDGVLPSSKGADGVLSDADRLALLEKGAALAPFGVKQSVAEQFLVYSALSKPKEKLCVSWAAVGFDGETLRKSTIIEKLEMIFPSTSQILANTSFYSKKLLLSEVASKVGELRDGANVSEVFGNSSESGFAWAGALKWISENGGIDFVLDGVFASRRFTTLSKKGVDVFLKKDIYSSITRIEKYIKCPFSYFAEYGLRARERPVYGLSAIDMGNVFHDALDSLSKRLADCGKKWGELENGAESEMRELVENCVDEACGNLDVFDSTKKNKYIVSRAKRITKRAVWAIDRHIAAGSFVPHEYEASFGGANENSHDSNVLPPIIIELNDGYRLIFSGRIDRVDVCDKDGTRYVKIIDYKTGSKTFNMSEVYYGLQLQLMLYMDAYLKSGERMKPAGILYFRVFDPIVDIKKSRVGDSEVEIANGILAGMRPSGLVVRDSEVIDALHKGLEGASEVVPVKLSKGGEPIARQSSLADEEQFRALMERTAEVVREAGNRLIAGDIEPMPVKGVGGSPCDYCKFGSVCGFDVNDGYRRRNLKKLDKEKILEGLSKIDK